MRRNLGKRRKRGRGSLEIGNPPPLCPPHSSPQEKKIFRNWRSPPLQYRERRWKRNRLEYIVRSEINEIEERIRRRGAT